MIVVPADDVVFIGIGLFSNTIVENEHTIVLLDGPHMWLDCPPQIARCAFCASQKALHSVMADLSVEQGRKPGRRRLPKRANQVVAVQVKQFVICHWSSLLQLQISCCV